MGKGRTGDRCEGGACPICYPNGSPERRSNKCELCDIMDTPLGATMRRRGVKGFGHYAQDGDFFGPCTNGPDASPALPHYPHPFASSGGYCGFPVRREVGDLAVVKYCRREVGHIGACDERGHSSGSATTDL